MCHTVMSTTMDYCRHIKALLTPYLGAIIVRGIDLRCEGCRVWGLVILPPKICFLVFSGERGSAECVL